MGEAEEAGHDDEKCEAEGRALASDRYSENDIAQFLERHLACDKPSGARHLCGATRNLNTLP